MNCHISVHTKENAIQNPYEISMKAYEKYVITIIIYLYSPPPPPHLPAIPACPAPRYVDSDGTNHVLGARQTLLVAGLATATLLRLGAAGSGPGDNKMG